MNNKFGFVDRIKIYCKYPKYVIHDAKICINRHKENVLFSIRKKIINSFLNSKACKCRFNTNDGQINSAILFPCTIVSMVLLEHFKRIEWLRIHGIHVDTHIVNNIVVSIELACPGVLIGKKGSDINHIEKRLSEIFGNKVCVDIKEVHDVNADEIYKNSLMY